MQVPVKKGKSILFLLISAGCFVLMIWANYLMKIEKKIQLSQENVPKVTQAVLNDTEKRHACYFRNTSDDVSVEFFPKLSAYFIQPKANEAIFFVDANCAHNGLLEITQRYFLKMRKINNNRF